MDTGRSRYFLRQVDTRDDVGADLFDVADSAMVEGICNQRLELNGERRPVVEMGIAHSRHRLDVRAVSAVQTIL